MTIVDRALFRRSFKRGAMLFGSGGNLNIHNNCQLYLSQRCYCNDMNQS